MSALLESIALSYGKGKITAEGLAYAAKLLGIDKQQGNPKYAISLGGNTINPMNMLKRMGLNKGIQAITSGGSSMGMALPLLAGSLGLAYLTNPLRKGSMNYNPELQGQINYLSGMDGMIGRNTNSGLMQYGPNSVLSGQGAVSMFGTNDYGKQLQKKIDKLQSIKKRGYNTLFGQKTTDFTDSQQELLDRAKTELENLTTDEFDRMDADIEKEENRKTYSAPYTGGQVHGNGDGSTNTTSGSVKEGAFGAYDGSPGRKDYDRGGIASL